MFGCVILARSSSTMRKTEMKIEMKMNKEEEGVQYGDECPLGPTCTHYNMSLL